MAVQSAISHANPTVFARAMSYDSDHFSLLMNCSVNPQACGWRSCHPGSDHSHFLLIVLIFSRLSLQRDYWTQAVSAKCPFSKAEQQDLLTVGVRVQGFPLICRSLYIKIEKYFLHTVYCDANLI